ncbi:hypothetical protein [Dyella subtropica]|uniref:hypothetical protein n=1 Tax=Dyella subtropica TaxID=2992127 RepID=UPI0022515B78|nr:hypothetical protein [Dyella subtropica]
MTPYDKYAKTLSYFLPARLRDEVVSEVMSNLYAELEAEMTASQGSAREQVMKKILARHQSARALAGSFVEKRSELIGRRVYPVYKAALWASLAMTVIAVASLSLMDGFRWDMLGDMAISSGVVFTIITLVFVAIDQLEPLHHVAESMAMIRARPEVQSSEARREISSMPPRYRLNRRVLAIVLLILLNVAPGQIGLLILIDEPHFRVSTYPILSQQFLGAPRMLVNLWCAAVLLADMFLAWKKFSRHEFMAEMSLQFAGLLIGLLLLISGHIFSTPSPEQIAGYSSELRNVLSAVVTPPLFRCFMVILWLSWLVKAWGFLQRFRLHRLSKAM